MGKLSALHGRYEVECRRADGSLAWAAPIDNLVTDAGKNDLLDRYLGGGSALTFSLGLINGASPTIAAADTMSAHAGWTENQNYSASTRPTPSWNSASSKSKSTLSTTFAINANSQTIGGLFIVSNNTKGGTSGVLYSAGTFTGGAKNANSGDTISVVYTATAP